MKHLIALVLCLLWAAPAAAQSQIVKMANLFNQGLGDSQTMTGAGYTTPSYAVPYTYTAANWDPAPTVYFEAVLAMTAGGGVAYAELRNDTDSVSVASSEVSTSNATATRVRSGAITLTTAKNYRARWKGDGASVTAVLYSARLVFIQNGTIVATETVYDIGGDDSLTSTTYTDATTAPRYYHQETFLTGTLAVYFEAFLSPGQAAETATVQLYDGSSGVTDSEVSLTGTTTNTLVRTASAITLVNGSTYRMQGKATSGAVRIRGARIILLQTASPSRTVSFYPMKPGRTTATSAGTNRTAKMRWDADEWSVVDTDVYYEMYGNVQSAGPTATADLNNGTSDVSTHTFTSATITRAIAGPLGLTDNDEFDLQYLNSSGTTATFRGAYLRIDATLSGEPPGSGSGRLTLLGIGEP